MDDADAVKHALDAQFARTAKALAHPRRIEALELLDQGERSVEDLAGALGVPVTTASSHLAVLRSTRLVETRRDGTRIYYRLADPAVTSLLASLREAARSCLPEVGLIERTYFSDGAGEPETITLEDLFERMRANSVVVIDVRPEVEYDAGHIEGALSIPVAELERRIAELPCGLDVVAYCRGPFCVLAPEAVRVLRAHGIGSHRLEAGLPEWRQAGLPTETTSLTGV